MRNLRLNKIKVKNNGYRAVLLRMDMYRTWNTLSELVTLFGLVLHSSDWVDASEKLSATISAVGSVSERCDVHCQRFKLSLHTSYFLYDISGARGMRRFDASRKYTHLPTRNISSCHAPYYGHGCFSQLVRSTQISTRARNVSKVDRRISLLY